MPNHVENIVTINGEADKVSEVIEILTDKSKSDEEVTFDNFLPMPKELENTTSPSKGNKELIAKYGCDNWYDWKKENYGTKWGAYSGSVLSPNSVRFQTAWSTPYNAMLKLSEMYPDVEIVVRYADEDFGHNVGEYTLKGGNQISENIPDGGSLDAFRMALEIQGDYAINCYLGDTLIESEQEDIDNDGEFLENLMVLAVEKNYLHDDYPEFILTKLVEIAINGEKYEYAKDVTELIQTRKMEDLVGSIEIKENTDELDSLISDNLDDSIDEVFTFAHTKYNTSSGDITPDQAQELDELKTKMLELILKQTKQNF